MRRLATRFIVALLTSLIGIAAASAWRSFHSAPARPNKLLAPLPPCRDGLVSVEPQPDAPVRLSVEETECANPQEAGVSYVAENISPKTVSEYEVRYNFTYPQFAGEGGGGTDDCLLQPGQKRRGFVGGGVSLMWGKPVGELMGFKVVVESVTFTDGATWRRAASR